MFSSLEFIIGWIGKTLEYVPVFTYPPEKTPDVFCTVDRTAGQLDYPHDNPEFTVSIWSKREDKAEELANVLAIAVKIKPPTDDYHINTVGVPNMYSYSKVDGGYFVWQVSFFLSVNLLD